jgi:phage/plasmid-like protein (TIGR03299 family)
MAHELAEINGRVAMFCTGKQEAAWHHLGQRTRAATTWQEAMTLAELDWPVSKHQLFGPDLTPVDAWGIFREEAGKGIFLGAVGAQYTPIQNRYAFEFVDTLLEAEKGAHYESAGALRGGKQIWCMARVPAADIWIDGTNDYHAGYLLFTTSHDGSTAATCKLTSIRVVCNNTLTMALSAANNSATAVLRVRHTKDAENRLEQIKGMLRGVAMDSKTLGEKLNSLAQRKMTRETFAGIFERLFPKNEDAATQTRRDNILGDVMRLYESNDRNAIPEIAGTAYNLLNAITEYYDHKSTVRLTDARKAEGLSEQGMRAEGALFGTGEARKAEALEIILAATEHNPINRIAGTGQHSAAGIL